MGCGAGQEKEPYVRKHSAEDDLPCNKGRQLDLKRFEVLNYASTKFSKDPPPSDVNAIHHRKQIEKFWGHTFIGHRVDYTKLCRTADFNTDLEVLAHAETWKLFSHDNWTDYVQDGCSVERPRVFNEWDLKAQVEDASSFHRLALRAHVHKWQDGKVQEAAQEAAAEEYKEKFTHTKKENEEAAAVPRPPKKKRERPPSAPAGAPPALGLEHSDSKKETLFLKQQNDFRSMVAKKQQQEIETW